MRSVPMFLESIVADLNTYGFYLRDSFDEEAVFETAHENYGNITWEAWSREDVVRDAKLLWSYHSFWVVADGTGDESSHVACLEFSIGVNFEDKTAPIVVELDFVENPIKQPVTTSTVLMDINSAADWERFKVEHLDPEFVKAEQLAEAKCDGWSDEETGDEMSD